MEDGKYVIECHGCGHEWTADGAFACPVCGSTQLEFDLND